MSEKKAPQGDNKPKSLYDTVSAASDISDPKYDPFKRHDVKWSAPKEILKVGSTLNSFCNNQMLTCFHFL